MSMIELIKDTIWIREYPVRYAGCSLHARMTVVRINDGSLFIHSPCQIDDLIKEEIQRLGQVSFIVAPGTYHYLHIVSAQTAFPDAQTLICPGVEQKLPRLAFDWLLGDHPVLPFRMTLSRSSFAEAVIWSRWHFSTNRQKP